MCNGSRVEAWLDRRVKTPSIDLPSARKKMIMTVQARDKLMSLTDVSEMLGIPVQTLYRWRSKGDGPAGYRVGRHVRYRREAVEAWLEQRADERLWGAQCDSPEPGQAAARDGRPSQSVGKARQAGYFKEWAANRPRNPRP
jgi:excisionase family DNA binding protein